MSTVVRDAGVIQGATSFSSGIGWVTEMDRGVRVRMRA